MSGMGGGGGGGGGTAGETDCAKFFRTTNVLSPDRQVLATTKVDDVGRLELGDAANHPVQVVLKGKHILGTVSPLGVGRLKECLARGVPFSARITAIRGGTVTVDIRPK